MPSGLAQTDLITQVELRRRNTLSREIARLQRQLDGIDEELYLRYKAGARVEPGVHVLEIETHRKGKVRGERIRVR